MEALHGGLDARLAGVEAGLGPAEDGPGPRRDDLDAERENLRVERPIVEDVAEDERVDPQAATDGDEAADVEPALLPRADLVAFQIQVARQQTNAKRRPASPDP